MFNDPNGMEPGDKGTITSHRKGTPEELEEARKKDPSVVSVDVYVLKKDTKDSESTSKSTESHPEESTATSESPPSTKAKTSTSTKPVAKKAINPPGVKKTAAKTKPALKPLTPTVKKPVEESTLEKVGEVAIGFVPVAGSVYDIYKGIKSGDSWQVGIGLVGLIVDVATLGGASLVKGGVKAIAREGIEQIAKKEIKQIAKQETKKVLASTGITTLKDVSKGWIKKDLYSELKSISPELLATVEEALKKGMVTRAKDVSGIKQLAGNGINGYLFELKLTNKFGNYRLLGNIKEWTNAKGVTERIIVFEKFITK